MSDSSGTDAVEAVPVIDLSRAPGAKEMWDRPRVIVYLWAIAELLLVTNPWQVSSGLRVAVLRLFGAKIDEGVVFRPRTRVKFPWKLSIGARSWIGEGVWFHNQDHITVGHDVVLSQDSFLTTGSHRYSANMALITRPIHIHDGAWITSKCMVTGGVTIGRSAMIRPMSLVTRNIPANSISQNDEVIGLRFK